MSNGKKMKMKLKNRRKRSQGKKGKERERKVGNTEALRGSASMQRQLTRVAFSGQRATEIESSTRSVVLPVTPIKKCQKTGTDRTWSSGTRRNLEKAKGKAESRQNKILSYRDESII